MIDLRTSLWPHLTAILVLCACQKEQDPVAAITGTSCGSDGARVEASIGGSSFCANGSVLAQSNGSSLIVTGVSLTEGSLVISVDSMQVGTQTITEASNGALYTTIGGSYTVAQSDSGTVTIESLDIASHRAKGSCLVPLRLNGEGQLKEVSATFDVTWTVQ